MGLGRLILQSLAVITCPMEQPPLEEMRKQLDGGKAVLVDVRSQEEWDAGHVTFAHHVPITAIERGYLPKLPKDKIIYLHCQRGRRSKRAKTALDSHFPCTVNVTYNVEDFRSAGWPIR